MQFINMYFCMYIICGQLARNATLSGQSHFFVFCLKQKTHHTHPYALTQKVYCLYYGKSNEKPNYLILNFLFQMCYKIVLMHYLLHFFIEPEVLLFWLKSWKSLRAQSCEHSGCERHMKCEKKIKAPDGSFHLTHLCMDTHSLALHTQLVSLPKVSIRAVLYYK